MAFGLALLLCVLGLALGDVASKLRTDLIEFDSTIEKLDARTSRGKGHAK